MRPIFYAPKNFGVSVFLLFTVLAIGYADSGLIGEWVTQARSRGSIATVVRFNADGKYSDVVGAVVPFNYTRDKDSLILDMHDIPTGTSDKVTYQISEKNGDVELSDMKVSTTTLILKRMKGDLTGGLVGKWSFQNAIGKLAYMEFNADTSGWMTIPFQAREGNYEIDKKALTINVGMERKTYSFEITDGKLILTRNSRNHRDTFIRK